MIQFVFGLVVLAADLWAILNVLQSGSPGGTKFVWILVILLLPLLGLAAWLVAGPRRALPPAV